MKRVMISLAMLLLLGLAVSGVFAAQAHRNPAKRGVRKPISAVCPVMGSKIPDVTKAAGKSVYNGKTYYFCCPGCKPAFDKDPAKYVK